MHQRILAHKSKLLKEIVEIQLTIYEISICNKCSRQHLVSMLTTLRSISTCKKGNVILSVTTQSDLFFMPTVVA